MFFFNIVCFFKGPSYCGRGIHHATTVFGCPSILINDNFALPVTLFIRFETFP